MSSFVLGLRRAAWTAGYCLAPLALILGSVLALSGCGIVKTREPQREVWDDMRRQEKFKPQQEASMFPDQRASRRAPEGTIARGYLKDDDVFHTGLLNPTTFAGQNPEKIDVEFLKLGQTRYNVYCTPCHDRAGTGNGSVALKAPTLKPANFHDERLKKASDGELYYNFSNGKRAMPAYKYQVPSEHDRWAIVAYLRVLQRMSSGSVEDVPEAMRPSLAETKSVTLLPPPPPPPVQAASQEIDWSAQKKTAEQKAGEQK